MPIISVRIPQLGEGLQEALLVEFLKQPGDHVERDEPIYVMETDKATTDVESPYKGTLVEWTVEAGSVYEIGTEIAKMEVAEGVKEMPRAHAPSSPPPVLDTPVEVEASGDPARKRPVVIPPRTRKYLKEHHLLDEVDKIPFSGKKMMPADVDAYLASRGGGIVSSDLYEIKPLPQSQIILNYRIMRGAQACVSVSIANEIAWDRLMAAREKGKSSGGPTAFAMACWAVVQALKGETHEKFRSSLTADGKSLKVFHHLNLGIAVALPGDSLVTAVVRQADQMTESEFYQAYTKQVLSARDGVDQADESTTITISNIGKAGMKSGIPVIVAPAVATLALGVVVDQPVRAGDSFKFQPTVTATLSFDHRIVNGVGASDFLNQVKANIESYEGPPQGC